MSVKRTTWRVAAGLAVALTFALASPAAAAKDAVCIDPEKAGPDFAVQGEYTGTLGDAAYGCQVIALGDGCFQAVFYPGGLPGAGWTPPEKQTLDGKTGEDGKTRFAASDAKKKYMGKGCDEFSALKDPKPQPAWTCVIGDAALTGTTDGDAAIAMKKVERKSDTLGAKPPTGAVVLFDGTGTDAWEKGLMDDRKLLACPAQTKQSFQSFRLHLEFRTPFKPTARSQGRGNSGLYLQQRYEMQVLDSFGLEGLDNECAGIYKRGKPTVNMCLPPLAWQTYDVDFAAPVFEDGKKVKNAVVTVKHNGVTVYDAFEIEGPTGGAKGKEGEPGPVYLQGHGNPVFYRNIWIVPKE